MSDVCAVVLAAGEGTRLRPLTGIAPKALCPVGNVPLLDLALARLAGLGLSGPRDVAVNAWYLADQIVAHVAGRAHLSVEDGAAPRGTSGGVARLRDWIDGRPVLVGNADAYLAGGQVDVLLSGWDGDTVRMLGVPAPPGGPGEFGRFLFAGYSLLPWWAVAALPDGAGNLVRTAWRPAEAAGRFEVVPYAGRYIDTGTPQRYLAANLHALAAHLDALAAHPDALAAHPDALAAHPDAPTPNLDALAPNRGAPTPNLDASSINSDAPDAPAVGALGGVGSPGGVRSLIGADAAITGLVEDSVVGAAARVHGRVTRCVVWPGAQVHPGEHLVDSIRAGRDLTMPARN